MPALLEGVRVIELGTTITAPLAARLLEISVRTSLKVERPGAIRSAEPRSSSRITE